MTTLKDIQGVSKLLRYLVIAIASAIAVAVAVGRLVFGQWWIVVGDVQFNQLWQSQAINHGLMSATIAPLVVMAILMAYWLQRLFGEFQHGNFFADSSMRCFLWLVWLKVASFVYGMAWPALLGAMSTADVGADMEITVDVGAFFSLLLLVVIVHLLREAQAISAENKEFV